MSDLPKTLLGIPVIETENLTSSEWSLQILPPDYYIPFDFCDCLKRSGKVFNLHRGDNYITCPICYSRYRVIVQMK